MVLLAAAVASSAFSRRAAAQECPDLSVNVSRVVHRFYPGGDTPKNLYPFRPSNEVPGGIDIKDCQDDINLEFTLLVSGLAAGEVARARPLRHRFAAGPS